MKNDECPVRLIAGRMMGGSCVSYCMSGSASRVWQVWHVKTGKQEITAAGKHKRTDVKTDD